MLARKHTPRLPGSWYPAASISEGAALPYRGRYGAERPAGLMELPLPPDAMPLLRRGRPLKRWRYVGFLSPELMLCLAEIRLGPMPDSFWAVWDRRSGRLRQGTGPRGGTVRAQEGRASIRARAATVELAFTESDGVESMCRSGASYAWTRKQGGQPALADVDGERLHGRVVVDDTAAYYERHTRWRWSAGAGSTRTGQEVAWSLVDGVNDPAHDSERTIWVDGEPREVPPSAFAEDLSAVDDLQFQPEAEFRRRVRFGVVRSDYRQPFGRFSGLLPGGLELDSAWGVMEDHDAWW